MTMDDKSVEPGEGVSNATPTPPQRRVQAEKALGEAGEAVQQAARQAWSQASGVADDMLTTARHATQAASRQVDEQPLMAAIVGFTLGYIVALLVHGRR
jgi:ElaB/YqjD/DUF883 family membrane-anchored ribosome-binding protein